MGMRAAPLEQVALGHWEGLVAREESRGQSVEVRFVALLAKHSPGVVGPLLHHVASLLAVQVRQGASMAGEGRQVLSEGQNTGAVVREQAWQLASGAHVGAEFQ